MGAVDLIANGKDVAVIDYHTGDNYANAYSNSRLSLYGLTGTPTAWFDGGNVVIGGNHTQSMYSSYLPKYNIRKNIQSSFTIGVEGSNSGLIDYELVVTMEKVASTTATNMVLHVVVTESDIQENWQGMTELNHVERLMAPNQNGTSLDFSGSDIVVKTINFSVDPAWVNENCEVVAFIQNTQNKEVLQGVLYNLSDFGTSNTNDAALIHVVAPKDICNNSFVPKVEIANYGLDNLTSLDIVYDVNGETPMTFNWIGNLATYESEVVVLDEISFTMMDQNTLNLTCVNPNGQIDQFPSNNSQILDLNDAANVTSPVSLALKLDDNPGETTWELFNSAGDVLYSGGPYTNAGQFVIEQFNLDNIDCYTFVIYDEGGDGLTGLGSYKLAYQGSTIFAEGKEFGFEDQLQFGIGLVGVDNQVLVNQFNVSPNPVDNETNISFTVENPTEVQMKVYNTVGKVVFETQQQSYSSGIQTIRFNREQLESGLYFIQLSLGDDLLTKKVILK